MNFIKTHGIFFGFGASCFLAGYAIGGIMEARSMQNNLAHNILSQVTGQQNRMKESREESEKRFQSMPRLNLDSKKKAGHFLPDVGVEEVDLPGKYYVEMKVKAIGNPTSENIEEVKGMNARLIEGNEPYQLWLSSQKGTSSFSKRNGS